MAALLFSFWPLTGQASDPAWWNARGATNNALTPNDNAVVTQGQLKQFTAKAVAELNAHLPGGAGDSLNNLVATWHNDYETNGQNPKDFEVMNVGQLKFIANLIWPRLIVKGYNGAAPGWLGINPDTDTALATLGQLKTVFNFDLSNLGAHITSPTIVNAATGIPFVYVITADNNPTAFTAGVPSGWAVNTGTGVITGTPASTGVISFGITAGNGTTTGSATLVINVQTASTGDVVINSPSSATATVGTNFIYQITATGFPISFGASSLPSGLNCDPFTGIISGVPTTTGSASIGLSASNGTNTDSSHSLALTILPASSGGSSGSSPVLRDVADVATVGLPYSFTYQAGGIPAPTFSVTTGSLPPGLSLSSAGAISGTPTTVGTYMGKVSASNGIGATASQDFTIVVQPGVSLAMTAMFNFEPVGVASPGGNWNTVIGYSTSSSITNARDFSSGAATGIGLSITSAFTYASNYGVVSTALYPSPVQSYAAATTGTAAVTFSGLNPSVSYNLTVFGSSTSQTGAGNYTIGTTTLALGISGNTNHVVTFINVVPDSTGHIVLTASKGTMSNNNNISVLGLSASAAGAPVITNGPALNATAGTSYSFTYTASASPSATFSVSSGLLPPGLSLSSSGTISGTATSTGTFNGRISANNGVGYPDSQPFSIVVQASASPTAVARFNFAYNATSLGNWNSVTDWAAGVITNAKDYNTGASSGIGLAVSSSFTYGQNYGIASSVLYPAPIQTYAFATTTSATLTLSGLNPLLTYGLTIFGSSTSQTGVGNYTIGTAVHTLAISNNVNTTASFSNVAPDSAGRIVLTVAKGTLTSYNDISVLILSTTAPPSGAPAITNGPAPGATLGTAYSFTYTATGTPTPTFSLSSGSLPAGLSLSSSGTISGTPTVVGTAVGIIRAANGVGLPATSGFSIAISQAPAFTNGPPPATALIGSPYGFAYHAAGSPAPTFSISTGSLPAGLSLSSSGVISGTPTSASTSTGTVRAGNGVGTAPTQNFSIVVQNPPASSFIARFNFERPSVATPGGNWNTVTDWVAGSVANAKDFNTGSTTGVSLHVTTPFTYGDAYGTASTALYPSPVQTYAFATASGAHTGAVTLAGLNPATVYNLTIFGSESGGSGMANYTIGAATLPMALGNNVSNTVTFRNVLPDSSGNIILSVTAGTAHIGDLSVLTLSPSTLPGQAPSISNAPVPFLATAGQPYSYSGFAAGITGATSFTAVGLPAGLTIGSSTGIISGTATEWGNFNVIVTGTNTSGSSSAFFTLVVAPPSISITSPAIANGSVGSVFYYAINATNGATSYSATGLPSGLSINTVSGEITGTPTTAGTSYATLRASDFTRTSIPFTLTVMITSVPPAVITSALTASATTGSFFQYAITATDNPTSYGATGVPAGLAVNSTTGVITGIPTVPGIYTVGLKGVTTQGTATANLSLVVTNPGPAIPVIVNPDILYVTQGVSFSYTIAATNSPSSYATSTLPAGLTLSGGVISGTLSTSGAYPITMTAHNSLGDGPTVSMVIAAIKSSGTPLAVTSEFQAGVSPSTFYQSGSATLKTNAGLDGITSGGLTTGNPGTGGEVDRALASFNLSDLPPDANFSVGTLTLYCSPSSSYSSSTTVGVYRAASAFVPGYATWGQNSMIYGSGATDGSIGSATSWGSFSLDSMSVNSSVTSSSIVSGSNLHDALAASSTLNLMLLDAGVEANPTGAKKLSYFSDETDLTVANHPKLSVGYTTLAPPVILPSSTLYVREGDDVSHAIHVLNNSGSVTFSGSISPSGSGLSFSGGVISGTADTPGLYTLTLSAANTNGTATGTMQVAVGTDPFPVTSEVDLTVTVGTSFNDTTSIPSALGVTPYTDVIYTTTTGLPQGLQLDAKTGAITGTPVHGITSPFNAAVYVEGYNITVVFTIVDYGDPAITSSPTVTGTVGSSFSFTVTTSGVPNYIQADNLPPGLTMGASGIVTGTSAVISGTPTVAGTSPVYLTTWGDQGQTASQTLAVTILPNPADTTINFQAGVSPTSGYTAPAVRIVSDSAHTGYATTNYNGETTLPVGRYSTTGLERGLLAFDLSAIPSGAIITGATLALTGTSGGNGGWVQIEVHQSGQSFNPATATWNANSAYALAPLASLPVYSYTSGAQTFTGNALFAEALNQAHADGGPGVIYLTLVAPAAEASSYSGYVNFLINNTSTPSQNPKLTVTYTIPGVTQAPVVTSAPVVTGTVNTAFTYTITATNSPTSFLKTGTLPPGLTLHSTTGVIDGTANTLGSYVFTVGAANATGTGSQEETFNIDSATHPDDLSIHAGDHQVGQYGTFLANPLVVLAKNGGTPLQNALVTFTTGLNLGGLSTSNTGTPTPRKTLTVLTDASGYATVYLQLPPAVLTMTVTATAAGTGQPVTFVETSAVTAGQSSDLPILSILKGGGQSGAANAVLTKPIVVQAIDAEGKPFDSLPLSLYVTDGGGSISLSYSSSGTGYSAYSSGSPLTTTTNSQGQASIYLKLGPGGLSGTLNRIKCTSTSGTVHPFIYLTAFTQVFGDTPDPGGNGTWQADAGSTPLTPPTGLTITVPDYNSPGDVTLTWSSSASAISFLVERQISGKGWTTLKTPGSTTTTDSGLLAGQRYEYRVSALAGGYQSAPSAVASYEVPLIKMVSYKSMSYEYNDDDDDEENWYHAWDEDWLPTTIPSGYLAADLPDISPGYTFDRDQSDHESEITAAQYKFTFNPSIGPQFKWYVIRDPYDNPSGNKPHEIFQEQSTTAHSGDSAVYTIYPYPGPSNRGWYYLALKPVMDVVDANGNAPLDPYEKSTVGAEVTMGASGAAYFTVDNLSSYPKGTYTLSYNPTYFTLYDEKGNTVGAGQTFKAGDSHSFKVVANPGAADGSITTVTMTLKDQDGSVVNTDTCRFIVQNPFDLTIPVEEAAGSRYRKIALNGLPMPDEKPQQSAETDQEKEETYVDALTVGLHHSTTDVYLPVSGSDFAISARRNSRSQIWNTRNGLRPHEEPDLPFGNCWSSNLAANIRIVSNSDPKKTQPDQAYVTDDTGSVHTFYIWYKNGQRKFFPMPSAQNEQSTPNLESLTEDDTALSETYTFKREFGSTLIYRGVQVDPTQGGNLVIQNDRTLGSNYSTTNHYARLISATDRIGNTINYTFNGANTLIPSTISVANQPDIKMYIKQQPVSEVVSGSTGTQSVITAIWDANNNKTTFHYVASSSSDGDTKSCELSYVTAPDSTTTHYTYNTVSEPDLTPHAKTDPGSVYSYEDIASITDPLSHTYAFTYAMDRSKENYMSNTEVYTGYYIRSGIPRNISSVTLPNGTISTFDNSHSAVYVMGSGTMTVGGQKQVVVKDASGFVRTYNFPTSDAQVINLPQFPDITANSASATKIVAYKTMSIDYGTFGHETFQFNLNAGMALTQITDLSGNITHFYQTDAWSAPKDYLSILAGATFNGYYPDPTSQVDALGHTKSFVYTSASRIMTDVTDERGNKTHYDVDPLGRRTTEKRENSSSQVMAETDFVYGNPKYPGFITKKTMQSQLFGDSSDAVPLETQYVPDANGRVAQEIVDPGTLHLVTTYTYDANGNKTSSTDPLGHTTWFNYDSRNHLITVTYPDGAQKQMVYDYRGNKIIEYDENGLATLYQYDSLSRLTTQARDMNRNRSLDPSTDLVTSFTYNAVNSKLTTTDPMGGVTTMTYDSLQRVTQVKDALNNVTQFTYGINSGGNAFDSSSFKPTHTVDPRGFTTDVTYDALYRPIRKAVQYDANAPASATTTLYDEVGNVTRETDPLGNQTSHTYDALNRLSRTTFADDTSGNQSYVEYSYTSTGLKWKTYVKNGGDGMHTDNDQTTTTIFDGAGRPTSVTQPSVIYDTSNHSATPITYTYYDAAGNVVETKNPLGNIWDYTYDARNRKVQEFGPAVIDKDPANTGTTYNTSVRPVHTTIYDQAGRVMGVRDPRGAETDTTYDDANRVTDVDAPSVPVAGGSPARPNTHSTYDKNGNVLTLRDPNTHTTTNTYDALNRLTKTIDAVGNAVKSTYDAVGNKIVVSDGNNHATSFAYDGLNRNTQVIDAAGKVTRYKYDGLNKTQRIDALGQITSYFYDSRNRLVTTYYGSNAAANSQRNYTYDKIGNLTAVTEPSKTAANVAYSYDLLNRIMTETSAAKTHTFTYDLAGNRIQTIYGGTNRTITGTYDTLNRLSSMQDRTAAEITGSSSGRLTAYAYDLNGNIVGKTLPNGNVISESYDALNRGMVLGAVVTTGSASLYSYTYHYDLVGNVATIAETYTSGLGNRTVTNTYDAANRLSVEAVTGSSPTPTGTSTYTYDHANNRTAKVVTGTGATSISYSYNSLNQLTSYSDGTRSVALTYDYDGNRSTRVITGGSDNGTDTYSYDFENRLISLAKGTAGSTGTYAYGYDYRTRRIVRDESATTGGTYTGVVFSGGTSVQEYDGTGTPTLTVEYLRGSDYGGGIGGILYTYRPSGSVYSYTHEDKRGDVIAKTAATTGTATYQAQYEAFGKRPAEHGSTSDRQKANTKDEDPTGLLDEGMRYRDLETGSFITRDPAGFVDGPNLYTYVLQNPWTMFDPEGLRTATEAYNDAKEAREKQQQEKKQREEINKKLISLEGKTDEESNRERDQLINDRGDLDIAIINTTRELNSALADLEHLEMVAESLKLSPEEAGQLDTTSAKFQSEYNKLLILGLAGDVVTSLDPEMVGGGKALGGILGLALKSKAINLPGVKKITIDIEHVLSGHTSTGMRAISSGKKTLFPSSMSKDQIKKAIMEAYSTGKKMGTQGDRILVQGTSKNGLKVEMWVNTATNEIESAYPLP